MTFISPKDWFFILWMSMRQTMSVILVGSIKSNWVAD